MLTLEWNGITAPPAHDAQVGDWTIPYWSHTSDVADRHRQAIAATNTPERAHWNRQHRGQASRTLPASRETAIHAAAQVGRLREDSAIRTRRHVRVWTRV